MAEEQNDNKHRDPLMKLFGIRDHIPEDVRNATLVVLVLVATASFQAVMSPPDHIIKKNTAQVIIFTTANVLAWSFAMTIIQMLMYSFPYRKLIKASCFFMTIAFALSAAQLVNTTDADWYIGFIMYAACIAIPLLFRLVTLLVEKDEF